MLIEGMDYTVRLAPWLDGDVPALVSPDEDGHYNIYINEKLAPQARIESFLHELEHAERDDFHSSATIREVEGEQTVLEIPVAVEPPPMENLERLSVEDIDAALRAQAVAWIKAQIEAYEKPKKRRYWPHGYDDPCLPPPIF